MSVDSINSVSSASSSSSTSSSSALSQETINKLKALGLDPNDYTSETAAQKAIADLQAKQMQQTTGGSSDFKTIKTDAEELAAAMGITTGNSDKISDLMDEISDKISELQESAGTDETKLSQVTEYNSQYTTISNELSKLEVSRSMTGANALANYNKASLGLVA